MLQSHIFRYSAPALMVAVAVIHYTRVQCCQQTPWKGGGFGMFSTVDSNAARYFRAYVQIEGSWHPIRLPQKVEHIANRIKAAPSEQAVNLLAKNLTRMSWGACRDQGERLAQLAKRQGYEQGKPTFVSSRYLGQAGESIVAVEPGERDFKVEAVRVELRSLDFKRESGELSSRTLWTSTVALPR